MNTNNTNQETVPSVDDLLMPKTTAVYLTAEELALLQSGLAAASIALRSTDISQLSPAVKSRVYATQTQASNLSNRLSEAQASL